ncbi:regulatory protein RecX [Leucothrix sargassi]|nr:regulatory protein RecX [Leucothrix sargassi]
MDVLKRQKKTKTVLTKQSKLDDVTRCWKSAIDYLSRREHSRLELKRKLQLKPFSESVDLEALLDELLEANYQSDDRYAESFVRSRILKGQGENKIRQQLLQRGVSSRLADQAIQDADVNWWDLAETQRAKRFGEALPKTRDDQAKQSRFLLSRGFPPYLVREITQA